MLYTSEYIDNMPAKGSGGKGRPGRKGKGKALATTAARHIVPDTVVDAANDHEIPPDDDTHDGTIADDEDDLEEKIAQFYEEHPLFYNQADANYKNKQKKNTLLANFAATIGWDPKSLWTRFVSNRTDHGKLKNPKNTKSGQAARILTKKQQFKLDRYSFLDAYIRPRTDSEDMGKLPQRSIDCSQTSSINVEEYYEQGVDDNDDIDKPSTSGTGIDKGKTAATKLAGLEPKRRKTNTEVVGVLHQMLGESRAKENEVSKKVEEALMSENSQDERTAWGRWLASTAQSIPTEKWRQFQCETFKVAMHFLPVEPIGDHPPVLAQTPPHRPILRRQQTMDCNVPQQRVAIQPPQTTTPMSLEQCRTTDPSRVSWTTSTLHQQTRSACSPAARGWDMNHPTTFLPTSQTQQSSHTPYAFHTTTYDKTPDLFRTSLGLGDGLSDHPLINTAQPRDCVQEDKDSENTD